MFSKISLPCFTGAVGGWFVAMYLDPTHSWWAGLIGAIVAFFLSYFSYEFKTVLKAVKDTWKKLTGIKIDWARIGIVIATEMMFMGYIVAVFWISFFSKMPKTNNDLLVFLGVIIVVASLMICLVTMLDAMTSKRDTNYSTNEELSVFLKHGNPVSLVRYIFLLILSIIFLLGYFIKFTPKMVQKIPSFIEKTTETILMTFGVLWAFIWNVYKQIHSEIRLIVGVDGGMGCAAGYFLLDNPFLGGLVAIVLGLINYYIISLRVLKTNPIP